MMIMIKMLIYLLQFCSQFAKKDTTVEIVLEFAFHIASHVNPLTAHVVAMMVGWDPTVASVLFSFTIQIYLTTFDRHQLQHITLVNKD